jgi:hypothetical protein
MTIWKTALGVLFGVVFSAAIAAAVPAWTPVWQTAIANAGREAELRGACETGGVIYIAAVSEGSTAPTPMIYAIPVDSASTPTGAAGGPAVKASWKGERLRAAKDLSNPLCDSTGVSFVVREATKRQPELVRLDLSVKLVERGPIAIRDSEPAQKWITIEKERKLLAGDRRLFTVDARRSAAELPIPGLENLEAILDLCAFDGGRGFALLTTALAGPPASLRVRRFDATLQMIESRAIQGAAIGSVSCSLAGDEIQTVYLDAATRTFSLARLGAKLAAKPAEPVVAAVMSSTGATGLRGRDSTFWALNSGMRSRVYEVAGTAPPAIAWMESDVQRWGTTTNAPAVILLGDDSLVLVMEAIDRAAAGSKVLRVVRLAR